MVEPPTKISSHVELTTCVQTALAVARNKSLSSLSVSSTSKDQVLAIAGAIKHDRTLHNVTLRTRDEETTIAFAETSIAQD